jgi:hypothetical protein
MSQLKLKQFIIADIEDKACCALLPQFLTDQDLLSLSSASSQTLPYRYYLRNVFIKPSREATLKKARFLHRQKRLQSITVYDAKSIPLALKWLEPSGATELFLAPATRPSTQVNRYIHDALMAGTFRNLRILRFYNVDLSDVITHITGSLCAQLRDLSFDSCHFDDPVQIGVCVARCRRVFEWSFVHCTTSSSGAYSIVSSVAIALSLTRARVSVSFVGLWTTVWDQYWLSQLRLNGDPKKVTLN